ncbi:unnamed protein product [Prorocentrum cordatum]|uniref:Coat protein n=1 Tax=Prorocentrum cordatum TaxID=2364126 RepID=A0ABN9Y4T3_9DINO|nr:unnamed protein product [Polarella glacialis]
MVASAIKLEARPWVIMSVAQVCTSGRGARSTQDKLALRCRRLKFTGNAGQDDDPETGEAGEGHGRRRSRSTRNRGKRHKADAGWAAYGKTTIQSNQFTKDELRKEGSATETDSILTWATRTAATQDAPAAMQFVAGVGGVNGRGGDSASHPPMIVHAESWRHWWAQQIGVLFGGRVPAGAISTEQPMQLVPMTRVKTVEVVDGVELTDSLPDMSDALPGHDMLAPPKEYRDYAQALNAVSNAPSYQYVLEFYCPFLGEKPHNTWDVTMYIKLRLRAINALWTSIYGVATRLGVPPGFVRHPNTPQVLPAVVLHWRGRDAVAGGANARWEANAQTLAQGGDAARLCGASMSVTEMRAAAEGFHPYPGRVPFWTDPTTGSDFSWPANHVMMDGTYNAAVFAPQIGKGAGPVPIGGVIGWPNLAPTPGWSTYVSALYKLAACAHIRPRLIRQLEGWFSAGSGYQEWASLRLPKPSGADCLERAVAWAEGKATYRYNAFAGLAGDLIACYTLVIDFQFHYASCVLKFTAGLVDRVLSAAPRSRVEENLQQLYVGTADRSVGVTQPWHTSMAVADLPPTPGPGVDEWSACSVGGEGFSTLNFARTASLWSKSPPTVCIPWYKGTKACYSSTANKYHAGGEIGEIYQPIEEEDKVDVKATTQLMAYK